MKCANCNEEIKDGSIYCPKCGKEAQMISGYSSLEDDFLHSLLREDKEKKKEEQHSDSNNNSKIKQYMPFLITGIALAVFIIIGVFAKLIISYNHNNSYEYQMRMARQELVDHNYNHAIEYLSKALTLLPTDIESRMELVDIYLIQEEYDKAIALLTEVIKLDENEIDAYSRLIKIYADKEQYGQIKNLYEKVENKKIKALFENYIVSEPVIYPESARYDTHISVTIVSIQDEPIYFTTDGSDPTINGKLYTTAIDLTKSGLYTIKAVCKNIKNDIYSEITVGEYQVEIFPPEMPTADLENDSYLTELTYVTLYASPDCTIYYTWDGSMPTKESEIYKEPLAVPEGENVLMAIAIDDKTGLSSAVFCAHYIYNE